MWSFTDTDNVWWQTPHVSDRTSLSPSDRPPICCINGLVSDAASSLMSLKKFRKAASQGGGGGDDDGGLPAAIAVSPWPLKMLRPLPAPALLTPLLRLEEIWKQGLIFVVVH